MLVRASFLRRSAFLAANDGPTTPALASRSAWALFHPPPPRFFVAHPPGLRNRCNGAPRASYLAWAPFLSPFRSSGTPDRRSSASADFAEHVRRFDLPRASPPGTQPAATAPARTSRFVRALFDGVCPSRAAGISSGFAHPPPPTTAMLVHGHHPPHHSPPPHHERAKGTGAHDRGAWISRGGGAGSGKRDGGPTETGEQ